MPTSYKKLSRSILFLTVLLATNANALVIYQGFDLGAGSLATAPNATTAAAAFDAALSGLSVVDFESASTPGFSVTGDGAVRSTPRCSNGLCGYNTTLGGANWLEATFSTSFIFGSAIDAFGAYFTGVQRADATLTYTDGSTTVLTMPAADLGVGGTTFFGFSDPGASIASIEYFTGTGGDFVAVDDIRFATALDDPASVPAPATLALFGLGLTALRWARRKKV